MYFKKFFILTIIIISIETQDSENIDNKDFIIKQIEKDKTHNYKLNFNDRQLKDKILEINFDVFSGNAYTNLELNNKQMFQISKSFFDKNEIYKIELLQMETFDNTLSIIINSKENSYYSLSYRFINKDIATKINENYLLMHYIDRVGNERKFDLQHKNFKLSDFYLVIFMPINCQIEVSRQTTPLIQGVNGEYIEYINKNDDDFKKENLIYIVKQMSNNKKCYFYVGGSEVSNNNPFILREQISFPILFTINSLYQSFIYPLAYFDTNVNIKLTMYFESSFTISIFIKDKQIINDNIIGTSGFFQIKKDDLKDCGIYCDIKIYLHSNKDEINYIPIDISFNTNRKNPSILKKGVFRGNIINSNDIAYFGIPIQQNEEGEIIINNKRGNGVLFGKTIKIDENSNSWEELISLPNEDDILENLKYDDINHILKFNKSNTNFCDDEGCLLFVGVKNTDKYNNNNLNFEFNIFARVYDLNKKMENTIIIPPNEFIKGSLSQDKNYYNSYQFIFDKDLIEEIDIEFQSLTCYMIINDKDAFPTGNIYSLKINSGFNQLLKITKDTITLLKQKINLSNGFLILFVGTSIFEQINKDNKSSPYYFRVRPLYKNTSNIIEINSDTETFCSTKENSNCNFKFSLFNYDSYNPFFSYIISEIPSKLKIYYKFVDIKQFDSCSTNSCYEKFLPKEGKENVKIAEKNYIFEEKIDKQNYILISVISPIKNNITIYTLMNNFSSNRKPSFYSVQLLYLKTGSTFTIKVDNYDYNLKITGIDNEAEVNLEGEKSKIIGSSSYLINKNNKGKQIEIKNNLNNIFLGYIYLTIKYNDKIINEAKPGYMKSLLYNDFPIGYYTNLFSNNGYIINFNINGKDRDEFIINSYLINSEILVKLRNNENIDISKNKIKGFADKYNNNGKVFITSKDISNHNSQYIYTIIDKAPNNNKKYDKIDNLFFVSSLDNTDIIPPQNIYINGYLEPKKDVFFRLKKENESQQKMIIELSINSSFVNFSTLEYPLNKKIKEIKNEKFDKNGKKIITINMQNHDSILLHFSRINNYNLNDNNIGTRFIFKYETGLSNLAPSNFKLKDDKVTIKKMDKKKRTITISFKPIYNENNIIPAIYIIKAYNYSNIVNSIGNSFTLIEDDIMMSMEYESDEKQSEIEMEITLKNITTVLFVTGKVKNYNELFGYQNLINPFNEPLNNSDNGNKDDNKKDDNTLTIVVVSIFVIFICIVIIVYIKVKKNKDNVLETIKFLSMRVSDTDDKEEVLIHDDKINELQ